MSKAALGTRLSALGQTGFFLTGFQNEPRRAIWTSCHAGYRPNAECRVPNAALRAAIPCTVTHPYTSVTTLPLVESGLIVVGRAIGRWAKTAASRGFARAAHCSFHGGMCIQ